MIRPAEAGFTLVEILVVLAIIGVATGATTLAIGAASRAPSAEAEARGLAARIQLAADDAMVTDRPLALQWDARGYAVVRWDGAEWRGGPDGGGAFARHALPAGMTLAIDGPSPVVVGIDGTGVPLAGRLANATDAWAIDYDGLKAAATRVPPA